MKKELEYQCDRIEAILNQHGAPAQIAGGTITPRWIRFKAMPAVGVKVAGIRNLSEELAVALDVPNIRVARQGAAVMIEVPRGDPQPVELLPLMRSLDGAPPVTAVLGLADDGAPILVRLPSPDVAHVLVAGTTGSGKTSLLRTMVASLVLLNTSRELALVLIDPKCRAFNGFAGLKHLARPVIREISAAEEALGSLVRLMEQRDQRGESFPPVVVFIDELVDLLMTTERAEGYLTRILQRGRSAGIHVVAATQKPTAAVIGTLVKANFPVRLVGKVSSAEDAKVASGWKGTGAERLMGRGDFIAVAEGRTFRFQAAFISEEELGETLGSAGLIDAGRVPPQIQAVDVRPALIETVGPEISIELPPPPEPEPDEVETLAQRLRSWWAEHSGEWGAKTRAVKYLFGDDAPAGGRFWELATDAIEFLEKENKVSTPTSTPTKQLFSGGNDWAGTFLDW